MRGLLPYPIGVAALTALLGGACAAGGDDDASPNTADIATDTAADRDLDQTSDAPAADPRSDAAPNTDPEVDSGDGIDATRDTGGDGIDATRDTGGDGIDATRDTGGDDPRPPLDATLRGELDTLCASRLGRVGAPGFTVTVTSPGLGHWSAAYGVASVSTDAPMTPEARLRAGSVTKTFNAAIALQLETEGVWSLDDPIGAWVPEFGLSDDVTIRRLLNHTAGVYNYTDDPSFLALAVEASTPEAIIQWALDHGPVFDPGAGWSYSNTGFYLTGLAIEAATGQSFAEVLHARLLEPNELADTFVQPDDGPSGIVDGHTVGNPATDLIHMSWAWAAGGLVSTTSDLCDWVALLARGDVLSDAARAALTTPVAIPSGTAPYGLGTYVTERGSTAPRAVVGHTGSTMGFRGEVFFEPSTETCVALLANDFFADPRRVTDAIWDALP